MLFYFKPNFVMVSILFCSQKNHKSLKNTANYLFTQTKTTLLHTSSAYLWFIYIITRWMRYVVVWIPSGYCHNVYNGELLASHYSVCKWLHTLIKFWHLMKNVQLIISLCDTNYLFYEKCDSLWKWGKNIFNSKH